MFLLVFLHHIFDVFSLGVHGIVGCVVVYFLLHRHVDRPSLADTLNMIGTTQFMWGVLVFCHRSYSWSCMHAMSW